MKQISKEAAIDILEWLRDSTLNIGINYAEALQMGIDAIRASKEPMQPTNSRGPAFDCPHCGVDLGRTWFLSGGVHYCDRCGGPIDYEGDADARRNY